MLYIDGVKVSSPDEFRATLIDYEDADREYGWNPNFPCATFGCFGGPSEEALYRSNHRSVISRFDEAGLTDSIRTGNCATFYLDRDCDEAIGLAFEIESECADYPVVDELDHSDLECELIRKSVDSYFRDDVTRAMRNSGLFDFLVDEDGVAISDTAHRLLEDEISELAYTMVAYCGELYCDEIADVTRALDTGLSVEEYAATVKATLVEREREIEETNQQAIFNG